MVGLVASSCWAELPPPSQVVLDGVPFFAQQRYHCGPAALASILNYWGYVISQEEISESIYLREVKGTLNVDLVLFARRLGFDATSDASDLEDLKRRLVAGQPVVALLNFGTIKYPKWHYLVVIGYDDIQDEVITHSGTTAFLRYPYDTFRRAWQEAGNWTLVVSPRRERVELLGGGARPH